MSQSGPTQTHDDRFARWALYLAATIFVVVGIEGLLAPDWLMGPVELSLAAPSAYAEIRAAYAGAFLAMAVLSIEGARKVHIRSTALMVNTVLFGVFAATRVLSWFLDGTPNGFSFVMHGLESIGFLVSGWLWRRSLREM